MYKWIIAIRLKTLPAAISPVLLGSSLSYKYGYFSSLIFFMTLFAAILIQIGTNFANDVYDFEKGTDRYDRLGPIRATQAGLISPKKMKVSMLGTFSIAILVGCYLAWIGGLPIVFIGIASIIAGIAYTGGPYPLGYNGFGELFVFLFFGIIAVPGTYFLQAGTFTYLSIWLGSCMGMLSAAILVVNNIRDIDTDKVTGKKTLAVYFGILFSYIEFIVLIICPYLILLYLIINKDLASSIFIVFLSLPIGLKLIFELITNTGIKLNTVLSSTAKLLFIFSLLCSIGLVI